MTRIVLILDTNPQATYVTDDPRPVQELVKLINTGKMIVGLGEINLGGPAPQRAIALPSQNTITVVTNPPPVKLSPRLYDVLFCIANGKTAEQISRKLRISQRTVYVYFTQLKERFGVETREELLLRAAEYGLV